MCGLCGVGLLVLVGLFVCVIVGRVMLVISLVVVFCIYLWWDLEILFDDMMDFGVWLVVWNWMWLFGWCVCYSGCGWFLELLGVLCLFGYGWLVGLCILVWCGLFGMILCVWLFGIVLSLLLFGVWLGCVVDLLLGVGLCWFGVLVVLCVVLGDVVFCCWMFCVMNFFLFGCGLCCVVL